MMKLMLTAIQSSLSVGDGRYDRHCSVRLVICFFLAIDQIAQFGLSSLKVIYYSARPFSLVLFKYIYIERFTPYLITQVDTLCFLVKSLFIKAAKKP